MKLLFICTLLFGLHMIHGWESRTKNNVFKTEIGSYIFVRHGGYSQEIPDLDTISALGFAVENVTIIPKEVYALLRHEGKMPSLKLANQSPDELMRVKIDKIAAFDPAKYWVESHFLHGHSKEVGAYNPAIVSVLNTRILMCWRSGDINSVLQFGWYHLHNHSVTEDPRMVIINSVKINGRFASMEDGRVVAINNQTIAVIFGGKVGKFEVNYKGFSNDMLQIAIGVYNPATDIFEFSGHGHSSQWMKYDDNQKNWVPFVHNDRVLMFQSINPSHIVKIANKASETKQTDEEAQIATIKTFYQGDPMHLPWNPEYGDHIKGGTPAIHVRGVMLSLFHTQSIFIQQWRTYFMGAVTFCPHYPFNIHMMSTVPIVQKNLYDGAWANRFCNYVLFPMGLVLDEDGEHIWVSMGYQDKDGYVIKLNINGLFNSMEIVSNCIVSSHQPID